MVVSPSAFRSESFARRPCRAEPPDLVISDIAMPQMDGYALAQRLRREPGLETTILVAITGYGRERDKEQALNAGFDYHLVKPVSLESLEGLLATLPAPADSAAPAEPDFNRGPVPRTASRATPPSP